MTNHYWPMFDIRLTTRDLVLRQVTEADLPSLAAIVPEDLEQNPASTTYAGLDRAHNRGVVTHQDYWRMLGAWRPQSWALCFGVFREGELVGSQVLEGEDFPVLRTVDSWSFLSPAVRGLGVGKLMRAAVLTLAFGPLGARFAITSAWTDNHASLGVSRALGYADNGITAHRRGDAAGEMAHLRLTRETWMSSPWREQVTVSGLEECLAYFGLDERGTSLAS
ncbi:MAG TPA: GNAT family protein [Nocardioidaceae bacterium]|nr:GNAT family protein [Nocardioidaceae bacterium]